MDLSYLFYKCLNTAWQKWRRNAPNFKYSVKPLLLQQQQLKRAAKHYFNYYMAMHNKKALSGLVLFKTIQNNAEKQKKERKCLEEGELDKGEE